MNLHAGPVGLRDTQVRPEELEPRLRGIWDTPKGFVGFLSSVDHKQIGIRYIVTHYGHPNPCGGRLVRRSGRLALFRR